MHRPAPRTWAVLAVSTLVASTIGFAVIGAFPPTGDDAALATPDTAAAKGDASRGALGPIGFDASSPPEIAHTPPFALETGTLPTKSDALDFESRYARFLAKGTEGLDQLAAEGHLLGSGTPEDPYILERFYVDGDLTLQSTDRAIILREGYVNGQLSLNYIGEQVYVHHVYAKDLRVNENVERSGTNTGGLFHDNHFGFVGQIRHFVGEFRDNQVGPIPDGIVRSYLSDTGTAQVPQGVVFNFDGFHGADVHHNTFQGMVDIKLHGHNHGDCFVCPIHDHASDLDLASDEKVAEAHHARTGAHTHPAGDEDPEADHAHDEMGLLDALGFRTRHSIRYHSLLFRDNTIEVPQGSPFALRYNDLNHAGDDQTANSEPSRFLEDPHVHYQDITFRGNTMSGAPFRLDTFNAQDERHVTQNEGILRIEDNTVTIPYQRGADPDAGTLHAFDLQRADGIEMVIRGNDVHFIEQKDGLPAATLRTVVTHAPDLIGFRMQTFRLGNVTIEGNTIDRGDLGVFVTTFAPELRWVLGTNDFRTEAPWKAGRDAHGPEGSATEGGEA